MLPQFTMELFLATIVEYQVADLTLVPPIVIRLVRDPVVRQYDLSCLKRLCSSAAPLSEEIIHIVDRIKEMIKVKGQQVAPAELEDLLLGHPDVEDCAVLGVPDDYTGERPKAYVVLKRGVPPTELVGKALIRHVQERRIRYKWVREIEFTDVVPKSPSGKILRRVLRDQERSPSRGFVVKDERERPRL